MKEITQLKLFLVRNEVTQRRLAEMAGLNPGTVSMITTGILQPNFQQKQRIANALGLSEKKLFSDRN